MDGHEVHWQKWRFRVGFTPREGLVLYLVRYQDHGTLRPVIYRASLAEMFISYGDPNPAHYRKNVFDMGSTASGSWPTAWSWAATAWGRSTTSTPASTTTTVTRS